MKHISTLSALYKHLINAHPVIITVMISRGAGEHLGAHGNGEQEIKGGGDGVLQANLRQTQQR